MNLGDKGNPVEISSNNVCGILEMFRDAVLGGPEIPAQLVRAGYEKEYSGGYDTYFEGNSFWFTV